MSLRQKLFLVVLLPVVLCLLISGWITNVFSSKFLNLALQRTSYMGGLAQAYEIERLLDQARKNIIGLSGETISPERLEHWIRAQHKFGQTGYREIAYIGLESEKRYYFLKTEAEDRIVRIPSSQISEIKPNPITVFDTLRTAGKDQVYLSDIVETFYPFSSGTNTHPLTHVLFRMAIPCMNNGSMDGILLLGIDARWIRNILSLYHSTQSPLYAFPRTPEIRYSFIFDRLGWMLFESESLENELGDLATTRIRNEMKGTIGKPGYSICFRPSAEYTTFWNMVSAVQRGLHGVIPVDEDGNFSSSIRSNGFLVYSPIRFRTRPNAEPDIVMGLAYLDRTNVTLAAQLKHIDVMLIITLCATALVSLYILWISRLLTRPLQALATAVMRIQPNQLQERIHLTNLDQETYLLQDTINRLLEAISGQVALIQHQNKMIQMAEQRERLIPEEMNVIATDEMDQLPELCGKSPAILALKTEILKAAKSEADVLITGETGTGKQLAAEAIHRHSSRCNQPFITLNCGALDENLLLDALFGHIPGAFSEAKTERKGAFLSADKGTLFLDEIGNASLKVQQSLLRTLSTQTIRPLGSDKEIHIDVRLIAATNENMTSLIERGVFREDLYFRLNVISITTPPLRDRIDDIPALVHLFLLESMREMGKRNVGISRGAMERLKNYRWPGNVRELKNCITRAVAMVDSDVLQTQDIRLEPIDDVSYLEETDPLNVFNQKKKLPDSSKTTPKNISSRKLNKRQQIALPIIQKKGRISRSEYQKIIGNSTPPRTAQYDLNDLTQKGFLEKVGKGPATRYVPIVE
ncbi:sigma 54-interacting transcriptional regulator [Desulfatirhabdium butyrativorans]|uniref:sigma 54-interacting transcriptional regulator n=1 Tax=Desulfatirhabdium butyrativorans TaxID=340467 RepID=UPI00146FC1E2|nr:sigma-54 dependent transcriptional regulator [Desulfatirhabdium butyrativorans]